MEEKFSTKIHELTEATSPLERFAKKVFDKLLEENIPPLPSYYRIYFFNMLEEEPLEFKKQLYEIISLEETQDLQEELEKEKKVTLSFKYTTELLQHVALLYKISIQSKELLKRMLEESKAITSPKILEKILKKFEVKLETLYKKVEKENNLIRNLYAKNVELVKEIESKSTFDARYGIYNKNYFLKLLEKEKTLIAKFSHISSLVVLKVKDSILNKLSKKEQIIVNRSLSKILVRTSRRTDEIGYLDSNIFGMLLKHTDEIGARKTIERIADMLTTTAVFLEGEEVELSIVGGIVVLREERSAEEDIEEAIEKMRSAEEKGELYEG